MPDATCKTTLLVTLTMNPAVDLAYHARWVRPTHKSRTALDRMDAGGGGINVARVLHTLGEDVLALIMTGGVTGRLIEQMLDDAGVRWRAIAVGGLTRIALNVHENESGLEYRFVPAGPDVEPGEWKAALDILRELPAAWVIASGSLPPGVPDDFYAQAARIAQDRDQRFVLDTSGPALREALGHGIDVLKLSQSELEFLTGRRLRAAHAQEAAASALMRAGAARLIAVSLGRDGALLAASDGVARVPAGDVPVRGAVGAGDSFLAGLVSGLARGLPQPESLALAVACGSVAVTSFGTAQVARGGVEAFYQRILAGTLPAGV